MKALLDMPVSTALLDVLRAYGQRRYRLTRIDVWESCQLFLQLIFRSVFGISRLGLGIFRSGFSIF